VLAGAALPEDGDIEAGLPAPGPGDEGEGPAPPSESHALAPGPSAPSGVPPGRAAALWAAARRAVADGRVAALLRDERYCVVSAVFSGLFEADFDRVVPVFNFKETDRLMRQWCVRGGPGLGTSNTRWSAVLGLRPRAAGAEGMDVDTTASIPPFAATVDGPTSRPGTPCCRPAALLRNDPPSPRPAAPRDRRLGELEDLRHRLALAGAPPAAGQRGSAAAVAEATAGAAGGGCLLAWLRGRGGGGGGRVEWLRAEVRRLENAVLEARERAMVFNAAPSSFVLFRRALRPRGARGGGTHRLRARLLSSRPSAVPPPP
jgi:hypothetical protein